MMESTVANMSPLNRDLCERYIGCSLALGQVSAEFNGADIIARAHLDIDLDNMDMEFLPYMNVVESLIQVKLQKAVDDLGEKKQQIIADYDRLTALLGDVADMVAVVRRDLSEVLYADYYGHCEPQMPTLTDLVNVLKATETLILDFFNETMPLSS